MAKLLFQTYLVILSIPFLTFALDPKEPKTICERLLGETEKAKCVDRAPRLDWYAASACNEISDDAVFMDCWKRIEGGRFNPEALDFCTRRAEEEDQERLKCILSTKNKSFSSRTLRRCESVTTAQEFQKCTAHSATERDPASGNSEQKSNSIEFQPLKIERHN